MNEPQLVVGKKIHFKKSRSTYENISILGIPRRRCFSIAKKGQVFQNFPLETRLHIMKLHFEEGRSAQTLAREYGASSPPFTHGDESINNMVVYTSNRMVESNKKI